MRFITSRPATTIGVVLCAIVVAGALLAPWVAPFDPNDQNIIDRLQPPGGDYLFGTDSFGRDVFSRILWGARISLLVAVTSIAAAIIVGGTVGMVSGYVGGQFDLITMQTMDVLLSFPSLILGLIVVALLGPDLINLVFAIALTAIAPFARIARAGAEPEGTRLHRGRPRARLFPHPHPVRAYPAQHPVRGAGDGLAVDGNCGAHRGVAVIHWSRREAADADLGRHDARRI